MIGWSWRTASPALAALLLVVSSASGGVDVALGNGDKMSGSLLPANEIETFRVDLPAAAVLKLKVKGKAATKGAAAPAMRLRVLDPAGGQIGADLEVTKGSKASIKGLVAPTTGRYAIQVTGDGVNVGNYLLVVKWKSPKKLQIPLNEVADETSEFSFGVEDGSIVKMKLKADKGSAATPAAQHVSGTRGFDLAVEAPTPGSSSHAVAPFESPEFGDFTVTSAGGGGTYTCKVSIKAPKPSKNKLSLSGDTIGGDPIQGNDLAFGEILGPDGGFFAVPEDLAPAIAGSSIDVPAGSLPKGVSLIIGTAPSLGAEESSDQAAGPTVFFGPPGLTFKTPVTISIPYDPTVFGNPGELRVFTRDENDNVTEITDLTVNVETGVVSFAVSHFSSFRVFGPRLPPPPPLDLDGDGSSDLVLRAPAVGRVYVLPTPGALLATSTADAPIVLTAESPGADGFGASFVSAELNGDGRADLVVGAASAGGDGRAYVFFGGPTLASRNAFAADAIIAGQDFDAGFGIRFAAGDLNGDGVDDLVVGAERSNPTGLNGGAAYVFFGSREFGTRTTEHADVVLTGIDAGHGFGASVAVGDVTGDGVADVIVGADQLSAGLPGTVYVFEGGDLRSEDASRADLELTGETPADAFGLEIAAADVTNDGVADLVIAAAGDDDVSTRSGAVYIYEGGNLGATPVKLLGGGPLDDFGFELTVGDLSRDGIPDVFASSITSSGGQGRVRGFLGAADFVSSGPVNLGSVFGDNTGDELGRLQQMVDLDGDGFPDLVTYASGAGSGGQAYVVLTGNASTLSGGGVGSDADVVIAGETGESLGGPGP